MTDFRGTKIKIISEKHSRAFQKAVFEAGGRWHSEKDVKHLSAKFLFVDADLNLSYEVSDRDYFDCHQYKEIQFPLPSKGHVHAELMAQYAEDAKTTDKPWELWQFKNRVSNWVDIPCSPVWDSDVKYRRKPKTHTVHGVEVPDISFTPEDNEYYFYPDPSMPCMYEMEYFHNYAEECGHRLTNKMCYPTTDEGREAAILHAKAMLGVHP